MKKFIFLALIALASCTAKPTSNDVIEGTDVETTEDIDDETPEAADSLMFWTKNSIKEANMPLVLLMDTVYRFARSKEFSNNSLNDNLKWMDAYREQLACYYDRNKVGVDTLSSYSKADSVIRWADRLWELDDDYSTMGMIVNTDIKRTRLVFQRYNELSKLMCIYKTEERKELLKREFEAWRDLETFMCEICYDLIDMKFFGGSITGPSKVWACEEILEAHIQFLINEQKLINDYYYDSSGVYSDCAKSLLISCCKQACDDFYWSEDRNELYERIAKYTKEQIALLPKYIDQWLAVRSELEEINMHGIGPYFCNLNTGELLVALSSIVCRI